MSDECSEATLRINGLARQMRRWRVSDLIERPKSIGQAWRKLIQQQAEIERLKAALAESCDENRTVVLEEGPFSTDMCPLAGRQQAEIERVETFNRANWAALQEAQRQIERLKAALRDIRDTTANQCTLEQWHKKAVAALEDDE